MKVEQNAQEQAMLHNEKSSEMHKNKLCCTTRNPAKCKRTSYAVQREIQRNAKEQAMLYNEKSSEIKKEATACARTLRALAQPAAVIHIQQRRLFLSTQAGYPPVTTTI